MKVNALGRQPTKMLEIKCMISLLSGGKIQNSKKRFNLKIKTQNYRERMVMTVAGDSRDNELIRNHK